MKCKKCSKDLNIDPVEKPGIDWIKVVCSRCNETQDVSMVRLLQATSR